jgi:hypothetical protein
MMGKTFSGQASLDFLMTYAWALLLIVLVVGALFAFGIFDTTNFVGSTSAGFPQIGAIGWKLTSAGNFSMQFENHAGKDIQIMNITAKYRNETLNWTGGANLSVGSKTSILELGRFTYIPSNSSSYTISVEISYLELENGWAYKDKGTVTGKVN